MIMRLSLPETGSPNNQSAPEPCGSGAGFLTPMGLGADTAEAEVEVTGLADAHFI